VCLCECVKVSLRVYVCGREKERGREEECVRVCVYERESVCERYRVCV